MQILFDVVRKCFKKSFKYSNEYTKA